MALLLAANSHASAYDNKRLDVLTEISTTICTKDTRDDAALLREGWSVRPIEDFVGVDARFRLSYRLVNEAEDTAVVVALDGYGNTVQRTHSDMRIANRPFASVDLGPHCVLRQARVLERNGDDLSLIILGPDLKPEDEPAPLNPPVPAGQDPDGVTVVHVDTGVNYLLPQIAVHLARGEDGEILGYDFWDMDPRPFDVETSRSPYFPIHHGTTVAGVLLREAPVTRLIPYRYPRPDMRRMGDVIGYAARNGARIVMMPLGSNREIDWRVFALTARQHPEILFVVSAGNDSRDIDADPVYPAALDLENMVVVTSADAFGRLAQGSNWGAVSVDMMVPAETVETVDHRGATVEASGSSYAVPRVTAMAVRLLARNPEWRTEDLIAALKARTGRSMERGPPKVKWGWVPNPLDAP